MTSFENENPQLMAPYCGVLHDRPFCPAESSRPPCPTESIFGLADEREQITALRDDVLRVRIVRSGAFPEDASWAVLPDARTSSVTVTPEITSTSAGFHTSALRVVVDRKTLRMTIFDRAGNVLSEDAHRAQLDGPAFRVYKTMPVDEHYFGLGDKTGPLDRRNQAFSLWNTDAYRFQESTDPLYKAIPFFMTFRAGRAMGVLFDNTWRSSFDFGKTEPGSTPSARSTAP